MFAYRSRLPRFRDLELTMKLVLRVFRKCRKRSWSVEQVIEDLARSSNGAPSSSSLPGPPIILPPQLEFSSVRHVRILLSSLLPPLFLHFALLCCSVRRAISTRTGLSHRIVAIHEDRSIYERAHVRLRVHGWIRGHVLRERSYVIGGGRSGAMPLWSEISKLLYAGLNVAHQVAQRALQREGSQLFVQLDEEISVIIRHQSVRLVP